MKTRPVTALEERILAQAKAWAEQQLIVEAALANEAGAQFTSGKHRDAVRVRDNMHAVLK